MEDQRPFSIHALELGPMANFVYLIHDHASGRGAVVDPAWEVSEVIHLAQARGIRITDVLLTHSHHDHINGIEEVLAAYDEFAEFRDWFRGELRPRIAQQDWEAGT